MWCRVLKHPNDLILLIFLRVSFEDFCTHKRCQDIVLATFQRKETHDCLNFNESFSLFFPSLFADGCMMSTFFRLYHPVNSQKIVEGVYNT